jgi:hypothetical protein
MSGGHYNYRQYEIQSIIESIQEIISEQSSETAYKYSDKTIEEFKVAIYTLKRAFVYAHRIDWLASGDDGEESFHERLEEELIKVNSQSIMDSIYET